MNNKYLFEVSNLAFSYYADKPLLSNVSFSLEKGDILTILGPNGAGKTTMFSCIVGTIRNYAGSILLGGKDIRKMHLRDLAKSIGYVTQAQAGLPDLTVLDYVVLGAAPHLGLFQRPPREVYDEANAVLEELDIGTLCGRSLLHLSGGELQQVQIARVLLQKPRLILLDEPTNHLDYGNQAKLLTRIKQLSTKMEITVAMTSHNPDQAFLLDSKVGILSKGGKMEVGFTDQILTEERLESLYGCSITIPYVPSASRYACITKRIDKG